VVPSSLHHSSTGHFPPDLSSVVTAWDHLPETIRAGIVALVQVAVDSDA
jgi:hypothetical protein